MELGAEALLHLRQAPQTAVSSSGRLRPGYPEAPSWGSRAQLELQKLLGPRGAERTCLGKTARNTHQVPFSDPRYQKATELQVLHLKMILFRGQVVAHTVKCT